VRKWIKDEKLHFDVSMDTVRTKLLPKLQKPCIVNAFSLTSSHPFTVEHVQTFLFRALFFLLEFNDSSSPPVKPTQVQRRQTNDIRFNVPLSIQGPLKHVSNNLLQSTENVEAIKAWMGAKDTVTPVVCKPKTRITDFLLREESTPDKNVDDDEAKRKAFLDSLQPAQIDLFKAFVEAGAPR
jgi:hypothetical protein